MVIAIRPFLLRGNTLRASFQLDRLRILFFSTASSSSSSSCFSAAGSGTGSPDPPCVVKYLVSSCGFSAAEAAKVSKSIGHLQSTEKADAALSFMRSHGFDGVALRKIISLRPGLLCYDVERKLVPRFQPLLYLACSRSDLVDIVLANPFIISLNFQRIIRKLEVWESLLGSREILLKHLKIKRLRDFLGHSIEKRVYPNLSFLRDECGIPEEKITLIVRKHPDFIIIKPGTLRSLLHRAEELGMTRSPMLVWAVYSLYLVSKENLEGKVELMKSLGWSDSDFSTAFRKAPKLICISQKELKRKMKFLVEEVGYTPSSIAQQSTLLLFSLDKRIIPRFRVMELLKSKGFWTAQCKLLSLVTVPEGKFKEKYVLSYKDKFPELLDFLNCDPVRK